LFLRWRSRPGDVLSSLEDRGHQANMTFVHNLSSSLLTIGDVKSAALDPGLFKWTHIRSRTDPRFAAAYDALWAEFGATHEMETSDVLEARFALGDGMRYEMVLAEKGGTLSAVRDHTAIWIENEVVVHLSHLLVAPEWRRSGLAGWMRTVPIVSAMEVAAAHGAPDAPVTLVAEMEYDDGSDPKRAIRLAAYERAGYLKIDPSIVHYHQPDFRPPDMIDNSGGPSPLPFQLLVRQVGRENERTITGARVRRLVRALYALYGAQFRPQDMVHPLLTLGRYPPDSTQVPLVPPTAQALP
jgi:hypothetical protein